MIHFTREGDISYLGLNICKVSDGGTALKWFTGKTIYYVRLRGKDSKIKPRLIFGKC
jgi:hypothetical protein